MTDPGLGDERMDSDDTDLDDTRGGRRETDRGLGPVPRLTPAPPLEALAARPPRSLDHDDDSEDEPATLITTPGPDDVAPPGFGSSPFGPAPAPTPTPPPPRPLPSGSGGPPPMGFGTARLPDVVTLEDPVRAATMPLPAQPGGPADFHGAPPLPPIASAPMAAAPLDSAPALAPHLELPPATPAPNRMMGFVAGAVGAFVVVSGLAYVLARTLSADPAPAATASGAPAASAPPSSTPPSAPTGAPTGEPPAPTSAATGSKPSAPASPSSSGGSAEAHARAALEKLRSGLVHCAKDVIGVLPGSSPAVPPIFATLKMGPYPSNWRDWDSPAWHCTEAKVTDPMDFQIQWQMTVASREGIGLAWLDEDGDGTPDVELSFEAKLVTKGEVDVGEIRRGTPTHQALRVR